MMKTRTETKKAACERAWPTISYYEHISFSTLYRRAYRKDGVWRYIGHAHDYSF